MVARGDAELISQFGVIHRPRNHHRTHAHGNQRERLFPDLSSKDPFFLVVLGIVLVGIALTLTSYLTDRARDKYKDASVAGRRRRS